LENEGESELKRKREGVVEDDTPYWGDSGMIDVEGSESLDMV